MMAGAGGATAIRATLETLLPANEEPELRRVLAMLCYLDGDYRATLDHFGKAPPETLEHWLVLGRAHAALGDFDAAESCITAALAIDPANPQARADAASLLYRGGSERCEPGSAAPDAPRPRHPAFEHLRAGRLAEGFAEILAMMDGLPPGTIGAPSLPRLGPPLPRWDGRADPALHLLVIADQGLGDALQFLRYIAEARQRVGRVTVAAAPPLLRLIDADAVVSIDAIEPAIAAADAYATAFLLPAVLGASYGTVRAGYLRAPPRPAERPPGPLRVGIAWRGNPRNENDPARSIATGELAALASVPDVEWHSLQLGAEPPFDAVQHAARIGDLHDTAEIMAGLDLVIAVDTAVAHLAGALGMPVWILLPASADWRWGELGAEATPWYPTARLFWQRHPGDWREALARVAAELGNIVEPAAVRVPGLFSPEECTAILAAVAPEAMRRAQLQDGTREGTVDAEVFSADWTTIEPPAWAAERLIAAFCAANEILCAEICGRLEFGRIIRYRQGDHFDWHGDRIASDGDRGRRLSITVQLSDPADYEGGDLLLLPPAAPPGAALVASRARGDAVVFRSEVLHRVAPVTRGERVSLVLWLH